MTTVRNAPAPGPTPAVFRDRREAEAYVASVCFKHGPPRLLGVELEWTVHHREDPAKPLDQNALAAALGRHAPPTLVADSPQQPLPGGTPLTVEPGGQVEISTPPSGSLTELLKTVAADIDHLTGLLEPAGLVLGHRGADPHRPPRRMLQVPRYAAMEHAFAPIGPEGITMMCSTAGLQVCLDFGQAEHLSSRWAAVHALGPVLTALFANSPGVGGRRTDWASARMRTLYATDPVRTRPAAVCADPAGAWARRVLDTPVIVVRRPGSSWLPPRRLTFADWIDGALETRPTADDLDYHLTLQFPPVRPRGYLEVRYLDTPPDGRWLPPVVLLAALFSDQSVVDGALAATETAAGRWLTAARYGLADPVLARAARDVVELGCAALPNTDLSIDQTDAIAEELHRTLAEKTGGGRS
ncbi:glutamate--cysteine ligase [Saccharothrix tamanrassetensis]|uniref:Glutamate--cysteine ligase EgtA n=1 Tax=Saccharothrix tamanrassetensis TaxID=1051531 RepID=A0A841CCW6_9PSEU|nr:ergothioneine biosynthesis glutamate--cysteine ligase EgtA [Saccharothrix tamanrassetensis]MBB5954204.1 glutamate--cysteine ligase [Saccharothrix tamanrassetensis]